MTISTRETDAFVAANRFGLGPNTLSKAVSSSGSMNKIKANPRDWLLSQISSTPTFQNEDKLEHSNTIIKQVLKLRGKTEEAKKAVRRVAMKNFKAETIARLHQAVISDQPLYERLVLFWSNHFTVSATKKNIIRPIVGAYEREAIRPHVLGTFPDMLRAAVQHPAMLLYLDNASSVGPNSPMGRRRDKGLNENLAREIMELHTLGVNGGGNGGYTQDDVIGLAKIITGWTLKPRRKGGGGYSFVDRQHEPGSHRLLGKKYSQHGEAQGLAALDDLALHPSTAKFIATKLARHFIADDPDEKDIRTLSKTYLASDGDLKAIYKTLIEMDAPWRTPLSKIKTPYEMVISSARLARAELYPKAPFNERDYKRLIKSLSLLEQLPFSATSPAGWPDKAEDWISPKATLNRIEWCHAFAQILRPQNNPHEIAREIIGSVAGPETLIWIERAPSPVEGLALFLASPEWQRR